MDVAVTVMGGFAVTVDGAAVDSSEWRGRQAAALVKILALEPRHALHREQLIDALWPGLSVEEAAPRLHKAAHYARRALGQPGSVVLSQESVALFPAQQIQVDARTFHDLAESALAGRDRDAAGRAADAYGGELLPQDPYEPWAQQARDRLHMIYLDVLRLAGRWAVLTTVDPTDEEAHLRVITELARRGERRAALRQFERLERALSRELGVTPSAAAAQLRARLETAATTPHDQQLPVGTAATLTPLVGGVADRSRLMTVLDTVATRRGRTVFVTGPAGVGKTALLAWLEHAAHERGMRVGSGLTARVEGAWPYAPVLEALADLCRRHPTLLDGLADTLRFEIETGLAGREIDWTAQSGHQRLFVAAAELLRLAAAGTGAMLVIDDAQYLDHASLRLLHYLARSTAGDAALLVLAHRPDVNADFAEVHQGLLGRGTAITVDVHPLTHHEAAVLVRRTAPNVTGEFVEAVCAAAEGLPFAVIELARAGTAGPAVAATAWLPQSLSETDRQSLAAAAVLGGSFDTDEFLSLSGGGEDDAYALLDTAVAHRILLRSATGYEFRHRMVRDALVDGLRPSQLRSQHRRAATALEALHRSPARISHHLVQAGDAPAAVGWTLRAAETAAALGAYHEALTTLQAIEPHARGTDLTRLLSLRADLLVASADAGAVDAYRAALGTTTDPAERSMLRAKMARAAAFAGDLETAAIALDGLEPDGSPQDSEILLARGMLAFFRNDMDTADAAASEARRRATLGRPDEWQTFELITLQGLVAHNRGQWFARISQELRSGVGRPALTARIFDSHLCVAEFLLYGPTPYPEVLELGAALRDTAERAGVLRAVAFATALRGESALLMGDLDLANTELAEAVDLHHDIASAAGEAHSLQRLAEVKLAEGNRTQAKRYLHRALPLARFSSIAAHLLQRVYGTMIAAEEDPETARAIVDRAEAALGVRDQCMFCTIMLAIPAAQACACVGDYDDAYRYLDAAESAARLWEGTAWQASIFEVRAYLAAATGDAPTASRLYRSAAELFDASGQPLDAQRCRLRLVRHASASHAG